MPRKPSYRACYPANYFLRDSYRDSYGDNYGAFALIKTETEGSLWDSFQPKSPASVL